MSRIECRTCRKEIPSETLNCPHCGGREGDHRTIFASLVRHSHYIAFVVIVTYLAFMWWFFG
jgi:hypothetical protein